MLQDKTAVAGGEALRDGGFAFVRIVAHNGRDSYTVSHGGMTFQAHSRLHLEPDSVLRVQIRLDKDRIYLFPADESRSAPADNISQTQKSTLGLDTLGSHLAETFATLGLPVDALSLRLVSFMQQMGFKADTALLLKCRKIAAKFPGHEGEAVELALLLAEKGIAPSEDNISDFLDVLLEGFGSEAESKAQAENSSSDGKDGQNPLDRLYALTLSSMPNKPGLMTFSNHVTAGVLHWIILPFLFSPAGNVELPSVHGNIRILLNTEEKKTEKIVVNVHGQEYRYDFILFYKDNTVSGIDFHAEPALSKSSAQKWIQEVSALFPDIPVNYTSDGAGDVFLGYKKCDVSAVRMEA